jgi:cytochrome c oxidase subunit II
VADSKNAKIHCNCRPQFCLSCREKTEPMQLRSALVITKVAAGVLLLFFLGTGCGKSNSRKEPLRIKVVAKKYRFEPREIRVKKGQEVVLEVTSSDVQHGFHAPGLGISEPIQKGKVAEIRFTPAARGEYTLECDIICGAGHDDMVGKIVVE